MTTQAMQHFENPGWQRSRNRYRLAAVAAAFTAGVAQAEPDFVPDATAACVAEISSSSFPGPGFAALDCVGRSAQVCMSTPGGDTTIGMVACLGAELHYWDERARAEENTDSGLPYDLEETELSEYKNLDPRWHDWQAAKAACSHLSTVIFDRVCDMNADRSDQNAR